MVDVVCSKLSVQVVWQQRMPLWAFVDHWLCESMTELTRSVISGTFRVVPTNEAIVVPESHLQHSIQPHLVSHVPCS